MSEVKFSKHASDRLAERNIWLDKAIELLEKAIRIYPTRMYHSDRTQIWKNGNILFIIDSIQKKVITVYPCRKSLFI